MSIDAFLKVDKIKGESQDADSNFKDTFPIHSSSFGASQVMSIATTSGGAGAGKANFSELTIMIDEQFGAPELFRALCLGTHIDNIVLSVRKAGGAGSGGAFLVYTMKSVFVTSYQESMSSEIPSVSVSFAFGSMYFEYKKQDATGKLGTASKGGWNVTTNKEVTAA